MVAEASGERLMNRTPMPVAPSDRWSAVFSRIQRTSVSTATVSEVPGSENFSVIRSPILRSACVAMNRPPALMFWVSPV